MNFRGVTWNLNGTRKFLANVSVLAFLATFGVIFLQETFETANTRIQDRFAPPGFIPRERFAVPGPAGHPKAGLKTLFNARLFGHGLIRELDTPLDHLLVVRWSSDQGPGFLFANVYVPRYSQGMFAYWFSVINHLS